MEKKPKTKTLQSVETTFELIEYLRKTNGAGVSQIEQALGIPKSTAHVHLNTLEQSGYLVNNDGKYHVGLGFLELGESARNREQIYNLGRSEVEKLANETGELASMMIAEHGKGVYIHRSRGDQAILADTQAGQKVDIHCRAAGKAILAQLPEDEVVEIIETHGLPRKTDETIATRSDLFQELGEIRDQGIAFDDGEQLDGLRCVAAPVTASGAVAGALSVSGPKGRLRGERFEEWLPEIILSAANVIEINLSYS
ncbi:IclR family transcriptional regulator [Halococcus agarilyticus]|uniref:IclR family transcriptional regulator n=1 Tax=Halococcus agarilyticus TaxID=1232219 RepID=UPI00067822EC|nr:IclR family transcriptional regulator [Halococcus agarilyticus]